MSDTLERGRCGLPKFFVAPQDIGSASVTLTGENAAHAKVLRLSRGDTVTVCDGCGTDYRCTVEDISSGQVNLCIDEKAPSDSEPSVFCTIYMALAKADKLEHVIQKATELGAGQIVAFPSSRCVAKIEKGALDKKLDRWQKIAASAAAQSGRGRIPRVLAVGSFEDAILQAAKADLPLFPYENEQTCSLRAAVEAAPFRTVSIVTGPEGGFSPEEAEYARQHQLKLCSLGPRILRCETAPLCALSAVLYAAGDLDCKAQ